MTTRRQLTSLSITLAGEEPPKEFCIFTAGEVETTKGVFLFDETAATSVMAEYAKHGIDLMIDYDHASLAEVTLDPAQTGKAAGWFNIELRDGALWAVNVRWTESAAKALRAKEWRFMSPAFGIDKDGRVTDLMNVAITNLPATHHLQPLVAASARDLRKLSTGPAFSDIQCAIGAALAEMYPPPPDGSCSMDGPWVQDVFDASFVYQLKGSFFEAPYTFDGTKAVLGAPVEVKRTYTPAKTPPASPPVATNRKQRTVQLAVGETMDPALIKEALDALIADDAAKCQEILKGLVASAAGAPADAPADPPAADAAPDASASVAAADTAPNDKTEEVAASVTKLLRLTGAKSFVDAVETVDTFRTSHLELETERQKLAAERSTLEAAERRKGCADMVVLGGKSPAEVWADDKATTPKKYLAAMPIADFRELVADSINVKGGKTKALKAPPTGSGGKDAHGLTPEQLAICAQMKCDPAAYAALMKQRDGVQTGGN